MLHALLLFPQIHSSHLQSPPLSTLSSPPLILKPLLLRFFLSNTLEIAITLAAEGLPLPGSLQATNDLALHELSGRVVPLLTAQACGLNPPTFARPIESFHFRPVEVVGGVEVDRGGGDGEEREEEEAEECLDHFWALGCGRWGLRSDEAVSVQCAEWGCRREGRRESRCLNIEGM